MLLMSLIFAELIIVVYLVPFMENDPPQFSIFRRGRRSCAATCQMTREDGAIIDICLVVFGSIALFSLHARGSSL